MTFEEWATKRLGPEVFGVNDDEWEMCRECWEMAQEAISKSARAEMPATKAGVLGAHTGERSKSFTLDGETISETEYRERLAKWSGA